MKNNDIYINSHIKERMKELHVRPSDLSRLLNMSKAGITSLLRRKTMQCDLLMKISVALEHDFFKLYCDCPDVAEPGALEKENAQLQRELEECRKEMGYLKRLVEAYEKCGN